MNRLALPLLLVSIVSAGSARAAQPAPGAQRQLRGRVQAPAQAREVPHDPRLRDHLHELERRVAGRGFTVAVEGPFVVIGDEAPATVRRRAHGRVRWTMALLEKDFFPRRPDEPLDVFVFKDERSYRRHALELFGDRPTTPYGYYSAADGALVMNIGPGDGTLVHELVHPYVRANLPGCPAWINEGLASLFERPGEVDGHLRGFVNWRLRGLHRALRDNQLVPIEALATMNEDDFYDDPDGTHYAQARYLLFYLQEKGLLLAFFREFSSRRDTDPTGLKSLRAVLDEPDPAELESDWRSFVRGLRL